MSIGNRIKTVRKKLGYDQKEFASYLKIPLRTLQSYEQDTVLPSLKNITKIKDKTGTSLAWLIEGHDIATNQASNKQDNTEKESHNFVQLPLLTKAGAAVAGYTEDSIDEYEKYAFKKDFIKRIAGGSSADTLKYLFLVRIAGDSMSPTLLNNEIVLVNATPGQSFKNGGIYLVRDILDESTLAKRIYKDGKNIILHSDNLNYQDKTVHLSDNIKIETIIIGRIVWGGRYYL